MFRSILCSVAALAMCSGVLLAKDTTATKALDQNGIQAMFVKADMAKNTVTFKVTDKAGKSVEKTLVLTKDAKILGQDNKPETLAAFAKSLEGQKDKSIMITEDKMGMCIVEIKDVPIHK